MIASMHDVPPRGNYFAEAAYLSQDLERGTLHNRAGARLVALTDEAMIATLNALDRELGDRAAAVVQAMGRDWGRRAGEQFAGELELHYGRPVAKVPLAQFIADVTEAFRRHGWGSFHFDVTEYAHGVIGVEVRNPFVGGSVKRDCGPADGLLAAFLGGMFSHFAGADLDGVQTEGKGGSAAVSRFVLTAPDRAARAATLATEGRRHTDIVAELIAA